MIDEILRQTLVSNINSAPNTHSLVIGKKHKAFLKLYLDEKFVPIKMNQNKKYLTLSARFKMMEMNIWINRMNNLYPITLFTGLEKSRHRNREFRKRTGNKQLHLPFFPCIWTLLRAYNIVCYFTIINNFFWYSFIGLLNKYTMIRIPKNVKKMHICLKAFWVQLIIFL